MTKNVPDYIAEAERLIVIAQGIRKRLNCTDGDTHVYGMTGMTVDIAAARNALNVIGRLVNVQETPKEDRDHECG